MTDATANAVGELSSEYDGADLHDARLSKRLMLVAGAIAARPRDSFPDMFDDDAGADGAYRFLSNERVTAGPLSEPHQRETAARMGEASCVLVAHDTSAISMCGEAMREGLGEISGGSQCGFYLHASLAIDEARMRPLGVPSYITWTREPGVRKRGAGEKRCGSETAADTQSEARRWLLCAQAVADVAGPQTAQRIVHVMDSEADSFRLQRELRELGQRYVIRLGQDRRVVDESAAKVVDKMTNAPIRSAFDVPLSARKGKQAPNANRRSGERKARTAHLVVTAAAVTLRAPQYEQPLRELDVHVVRVSEPAPPEGETPVDWVLYTTEPIDSDDDVLRVIRIYRARWLIEEFFKALKTGCQIEKRQLDSYHALTNALALFIPVAWRMLLLRNLEQTEPDALATDVLTPTQITIINRFGARKLALKPSSTVRDALRAVAGMGGHMNGKPGWLVIGRGMEKVLEYEAIWLAARATVGEM
ncbi:MAG TPA: IS4 family transposase [Kofleriaceae bacterium]|nr:IS4 family transposase [Kofleriaceae bacterium]